MPPKKNKKKITSKKASSKKAALKKKAPAKNTARKRHAAMKKSTMRGKSESVDTILFDPQGPGEGTAGQAGDLQALSDTAVADSESVDELLEEGNAFEAEAVKGVEDAPEADKGEIKTREVPEDDVPEEYLDQDQ